jgi:YD repeat-containing protein
MVTYHIRLRRILGVCLALGTLGFATGSSAGTTAYAYDALNRLVKVTFPDGKQVCYAYDKAGNRTQITRISGTCTPASLAMTATTASLDIPDAPVDASLVTDDTQVSDDQTGAAESVSTDNASE